MKNQKENFRERILGGWAVWSSQNWGKSFLLLLVITLAMGFGVSILKTEMTFYSILPNNSNQVRDMKMILEEFPAASSILAVVDARAVEDPAAAEEQVKRTIDAIVEKLSRRDYSEYVVRTTGKTDMDFFKAHGFMFSKEKDIERSSRLYSDLNLVPLLTRINEDFEREYAGDEDKLADEEQLAVGMFRGLSEVLGIMEKSAQGESVSSVELDKALDSWLFGESYLLSDDNKMGIAIIQPTFTMEDFLTMAPGVNTIESAVKELGLEMGVDVGLTGMVVVGRDEMVTSEQGIILSSFLALIAILLIMIFSFRMFSVPLISGIPLITGIFWTMGMSGFIIHRLNIMTAMYLVALMGLGIDFAIHLLTSFIQERDEGEEFTSAIRKAIMKSGSGILTGGLTTATAFFALIIADTEMIRELGFVAGMGIVCELIAMILFIPPLLGFRQYRKDKKGKDENRIFSTVKIKSDAASGIGKVLSKAPVLFSIIMLAIGIFFATRAPGVSLSTNLMEMEAEGLESILLQDTLVEEFGMAPDYLSVISMDIGEVRDLSDRLEDLSSVKMVDSLGPYYVSPSETESRGALIRQFAENLEKNRAYKNLDGEMLLQELYRLEMNLMEMGDMAYMGNMNKLLNTIGSITGFDNDGEKVAESSFDRLFSMLEEGNADSQSLIELQGTMVPALKNKLLTMASDEPVTLDILPSTLRDSYISKDGKKFLINVIPTQNPWEEDFRNIYSEQMKTITDKGTGMLLAGDQLSFMAEQDGVKAAVVALIVVFLILLLDFRNIKLVVLTMVSLLLSFLTLFGFMSLVGIKFDFINIIVVPLLIGIGVDDAVHINHRYLYEGKGRMGIVIGKTGTALMITSITTMVGFASFIPSVMRGMRSTGIVLSIAMVIAFSFSVLFHPGMLIIITEKLGLNIKPWGKK
ncbi:MAG: MMPL family transporter [Spirochaetaceae bacterium]|nr:MMPL family transporter [Spirochaetaceae bacterium]